MTITKSTVFFWLGALALIVGVGTGAYALSASLGVWIGAWDFRQGFGMLQTINPYSANIAYGCLGVAVLIAVLSAILKVRESYKIAALPLLGAIAAGLAWYVPNSFGSAEGVTAGGIPIPGIHDVSTDVIDPPQYVAVMPLRADAPNTTVYGAANGMQPGQNAALQQEAYPDLVTQFYSASETEIFDLALIIVDDLGWELVDASATDGRIEATATTFWFRFKDDVVIRISSENSQTVVDARSLSRVGGGDAGANALRLREFFSRLEN